MLNRSHSVKVGDPVSQYAERRGERAFGITRSLIRAAAALMLTLVGWLSAAQAQHRLTDADIPPPVVAESVAAKEKPADQPKTYNVWKDPALNQVISEEAAKHGIDPLLVHAVVWQESRGNPKAHSHKGAGGVMQMMPATAKRFGVRNRFDKKESVRGGLEYLAWLLDRYNGDVALALAGYNAGEGNVDYYGNIPPFRETQDYVVQIARRYKELRDQMATGGSAAPTAAPPVADKK
ncbi:MAG TPA: lytic transglycosylase domain-containing protein [Blastocatellia bacterium]|nr:lytic transglycosylase domain-containing protein [Blastocatellia bacterium]